MTATVRLGRRRTRTMKAAFLTIVPGLHAPPSLPCSMLVISRFLCLSGMERHG